MSIIQTQSGDFDTVIETDYGTFDLVGEDKVRRVIEGESNDKGEIVGGLGIDAKPLAILATYDKKGGLIKGKEGSKVKTGSFFDFKTKTARKKPEITYVFRFNGKEVEYKEGDEKPLEIKAAEMQAKIDAQNAKNAEE